MISKGNHVKFARFVLLAISEEAKHDHNNNKYNLIVLIQIALQHSDFPMLSFTGH